MLSKAVSRFVRYSPYKLRPLANAIRGKSVENALSWLFANQCKKTVVVYKVLMSAWANAKVKSPSLAQESADIVISSIKVDQGPAIKYTIPGSMGRGIIRRKRTCHVEVCLSVINVNNVKAEDQ